ncbi:hypothetical protein GQ55_4G104800 [Panicum hallii var. hallii]|uniref:Uncharacterized protein n=1 Tax=Panicum hallii var. hallii TaxID=1504633 RepID=A0A2T7DX89_9POAL|nr:hypothetical protein GQ55_4G104800 [Panicum hallii var. hallii]
MLLQFLWICWWQAGVPVPVVKRSEPEFFLAIRFRDAKQMRFGLGHSGCKELDSQKVSSMKSI